MTDRNQAWPPSDPWSAAWELGDPGAQLGGLLVFGDNSQVTTLCHGRHGAFICVSLRRNWTVTTHWKKHLIIISDDGMTMPYIYPSPTDHTAMIAMASLAVFPTTSERWHRPRSIWNGCFTAKNLEIAQCQPAKIHRATRFNIPEGYIAPFPICCQYIVLGCAWKNIYTYIHV